MKKLRVFNISLTVILSLLFIFLGVFHFNTSYIRFAEALGDLWNSVKFYFLEIFGVTHITPPTVEKYSEVMKWDIFLPENFESFKTEAAAYFDLLFSKSNLSAYGDFVFGKLEIIAKASAMVLPCILILVLAIKKIYGASNNDHGKNTIPLRAFKWLSSKTYQPIKRWVLSYIAFMKEYGFIPILWAILWAFHLNLASIIIAFFAYYFYFAVSFRFGTMYVQVCKLFIDLQVILKVFPWWWLVTFGWLLFNRFRQRIAQAHLRHLEARNCGFINELPIVSMTVGSMGKKKTTIITDMALSQEVMFRQKAFELIRKNDMKFPYFPWISFEMELRRCMEYGTVFNLATVKEWVKKKRLRYEKHENADLQLYGYDCERYGFTYDDGLRIWGLFDVP